MGAHHARVRNGVEDWVGAPLTTYELIPEELRAAQTWLERQRVIWEARLDSLDAHLQAMKRERLK